MTCIQPIVIAYDKAPKNCIFFICATAQTSDRKENIPIDVHDLLHENFEVHPEVLPEQASDFFEFRCTKKIAAQKKTICKAITCRPRFFVDSTQPLS
jgi:hypothetical protein